MSRSGGGPEGLGLLSLAFPSNIITLQNTTDNTHEKKHLSVIEGGTMLSACSAKGLGKKQRGESLQRALLPAWPAAPLPQQLPGAVPTPLLVFPSEPRALVRFIETATSEIPWALIAHRALLG